MNVRELRANLSKAFEAADAGTPVLIERNGRVYTLVISGGVHAIAPRVHTPQPDVYTPPAPQPIAEAPNDDKRYAVTCDVMGNSQVIKADLTYNEAEEFCQANDVNGEYSIVESNAKPAPQPTKRKRR